MNLIRDILLIIFEHLSLSQLIEMRKISKEIKSMIDNRYDSAKIKLDRFDGDFSSWSIIKFDDQELAVDTDGNSLTLICVNNRHVSKFNYFPIFVQLFNLRSREEVIKILYYDFLEIFEFNSLEFRISNQTESILIPIKGSEFKIYKLLVSLENRITRISRYLSLKDIDCDCDCAELSVFKMMSYQF